MYRKLRYSLIEHESVSFNTFPFKKKIYSFRHDETPDTTIYCYLYSEIIMIIKKNDLVKFTPHTMTP